MKAERVEWAVDTLTLEGSGDSWSEFFSVEVEPRVEVGMRIGTLGRLSACQVAEGHGVSH